MCEVNGDGRVRFGPREWMGIIGSMLALCVVTLGAVNWIVDTKMTAVVQEIRSHTEVSEKHQTIKQKDERWITRREFDPKTMERRIDVIENTLSVHDYRMAVIENGKPGG